MFFPSSCANTTIYRYKKCFPVTNYRYFHTAVRSRCQSQQTWFDLYGIVDSRYSRYGIFTASIYRGIGISRPWRSSQSYHPYTSTIRGVVGIVVVVLCDHEAEGIMNWYWFWDHYKLSRSEGDGVTEITYIYLLAFKALRLQYRYNTVRYSMIQWQSVITVML